MNGIFIDGIGVNAKEVWEIEHREVPQKMYIRVWNRPSYQWNNFQKQ